MNIFKCKVFFEDTDAIQVVYHANYLKFCDRARTQWMEDLGISFAEGLSNEVASTFVVADAQMAFRAPARLGDDLEVHSSVARFGRASIVFDQSVRHADSGKTLCDVTLTCAHVVGANLKPARMPAHYHSLFNR